MEQIPLSHWSFELVGIKQATLHTTRYTSLESGADFQRNLQYGIRKGEGEMSNILLGVHKSFNTPVDPGL